MAADFETSLIPIYPIKKNTNVLHEKLNQEILIFFFNNISL